MQQFDASVMHIMTLVSHLEKNSDSGLFRPSQPSLPSKGALPTPADQIPQRQAHPDVEDIFRVSHLCSGKPTLMPTRAVYVVLIMLWGYIAQSL